MRCYLNLCIALTLLTSNAAASDSAPDYLKQVAPIFKKHCVACHNDEDREGDLSMESFAKLQEGGEHGPAVLAGQADSSRLIRLVTGAAKPLMPPEDEGELNEAEITILKAWVESGARGPDGKEPDRTKLLTPVIQPARDMLPAITALAWSPDGSTLAIGRFGSVALRSSDDKQRKSNKLAGKINSLEFSADGKFLVAATGIAGLYGKAVLLDSKSAEIVRSFVGHRDTLYSATLNKDQSILATAGYDQKIRLWNAKTGNELRVLEGHNGAVYDLAFSQDSTVLASASGDETVKLWSVATGERLDTLSQPLAEQYVVTFSPDGKYVVAGGADNRIRVWKFLSKSKARINPLVYSRFAHEGPITALGFSGTGETLISISEDRTIKQWETKTYLPQFDFDQQPDVVAALALHPRKQEFSVGRMDGTTGEYAIAEIKKSQSNGEHTNSSAASETEVATNLHDYPEQEPNDSPQTAMPLEIPATVKGLIHSESSTDTDLFRFQARQGQQLLIEVNAARSKSKLDSLVEVLDVEGRRIERVLLRAVRDSYFTFRGKDSSTVDDFRVHNWREMELNEYLYANGEVVKLWLYPRGPDSGFKVYPGSGKRYTYFDTSALSHALHSPCYVVEAHPPGTEFIPNGLSVFPIYFENDDDSKRKWGDDSRLTFTAPYDGQFLVKLADVRGLQSDEHKYTLTVRPRQPDFGVSLAGANPTVNAGSGKEFTVRADRLDDYDGDIVVNIENLPAGFHATTPVIIEQGQDIAFGVIYADEDAKTPAAEVAKASKVTAMATIRGKQITKPVNNFGEIKFAAKPKLLAKLMPADSSGDNQDQPIELTIRPGETISARVVLERNGNNGNVSFGNADAGRNLAHGTFVDNIGLNGLLVLAGSSERTFFITAAKWSKPSVRTFHLKSNVEGNQTTLPVIIRVLEK